MHEVSGGCVADVWAVRQPEDNPEERAEEDMIEAEQRARVEVEIRRQVDYLMRQEIQRLKEVQHCIFSQSFSKWQ